MIKISSKNLCCYIARMAFISIEIKYQAQNFPVVDEWQNNSELHYTFAAVKPLTVFRLRESNPFSIDLDTLRAICFGVMHKNHQKKLRKLRKTCCNHPEKSCQNKKPSSAKPLLIAVICRWSKVFFDKIYRLEKYYLHLRIIWTVNYKKWKIIVGFYSGLRPLASVGTDFFFRTALPQNF